MTGSALTPHAALGWLRSLSIDISAAAILDANGAVLAGDSEPARSGPATRPREVGDAASAGDSELARSGPVARPREAGDAASTGDAERARSGARPHLISARSERHAIVVQVGPRALERLVRADLQAVLEALASR